MKRYLWLLAAIIIFFCASCGSPKTATPATQREDAPSVATQAPTPVAPTRTAPAVATVKTNGPTRLIPTIATTANQAPARFVVELDVAASSDTETVYKFVLYEAQDVFGIQFGLSFDPALITVVDSDDGLPGVQIVPGEAFPRGKSFVAINRVEQGLGTLEFAATRVSPLEPLDGQIQVASMTITTKGTAPTGLEFGEVLLSDDAANSLPVAPESFVVGNDS